MEKVLRTLILLGIYLFANGDKYDGYWKEGKKEGKGNHHYKNGDKFEGDYHEDVKSGNGKFIYAGLGLFSMFQFIVDAAEIALQVLDRCVLIRLTAGHSPRLHVA